MIPRKCAVFRLSLSDVILGALFSQYIFCRLVSRMGSSIGQVQSISGQFAANLTAQIGKFIPQAVQSNSLVWFFLDIQMSPWSFLDSILVL